ncbi:MAG TPA: hypothetical protein VN900_06140, partial [Stellaceae bacterium]|nr:hypothetical protein [Stellaceae bacterium]
MTVSSSDLPGLTTIAGFDTTTLFNQGSFNLSEQAGSFNQALINAGSSIAAAVQAAGKDPVQNGIPLIVAVAGDDGLSPAGLITVLVSFAHKYSGTTVAQDVGAEIASLVPGTLSAADAVSDTALAALAIATDIGLSGSSSMGPQLGVILAQLASALGSDPVVAAVQAINGATNSALLANGEFGLFVGLAASNAASVQTVLEGLIGSDVSLLSASDLTLSNAPTNGVDIANVIFAAYGTSGAANFWQGAALIQVLAQQASVSPVTALVFYTNQLTSLSGNALVGNSSLATLVGAELKAIIAGGLVVNTSAASDITSAVIGIAASGSASNAITIGSEFGSFLSPLVTGGGEGGGFNPFTTSLTQIDTAISGGTLTTDQGISLLIGASLTASSRVDTAATAEIRSLIPSATTASHVIALLALANAGALAASFISASGSTFALTVPQIASAVPSQLTPTQAVTFIGTLIEEFGLSSPTDLAAVVGEVASLINNNQITVTAAYQALNSQYGPLIFGIFAATTDLTNTTAAASGLAALLNSNQIAASAAISAITGAVSGGTITVSQAVVL